MTTYRLTRRGERAKRLSIFAALAASVVGFWALAMYVLYAYLSGQGA